MVSWRTSFTHLSGSKKDSCVSKVLRVDTQPRSFRVGLKVSGTNNFGVSSGPRYISIKTIIMIARITAKSETNFRNHEGPNEDAKKN